MTNDNDTPPASPTGQRSMTDWDRKATDKFIMDQINTPPPPESQATPVTAEDEALVVAIANQNHLTGPAYWKATTSLVSAHVAARNAAALARVANKIDKT